MIRKWFCLQMADYWRLVASRRADRADVALKRADAWKRRANSTGENA